MVGVCFNHLFFWWCEFFMRLCNKLITFMLSSFQTFTSLFRSINDKPVISKVLHCCNVRECHWIFFKYWNEMDLYVAFFEHERCSLKSVTEAWKRNVRYLIQLLDNDEWMQLFAREKMPLFLVVWLCLT